MRSIYLTFCILGTVMFTALSPRFTPIANVHAQGAGCDPVSISSGTPPSTAPKVAGDYVVWQESDGNDMEIWLYDMTIGDPPINISQNDGNEDKNQQIAGNTVVWEGYDGNDWEIWLYDIGAGGSPMNISENDINDDKNPQITGNTVVWEGYDSNDWEIWHYDIVAGGSAINISQRDTFDDLRPQTDGNHIVWDGYDGTDTEIWLYNISGGGTPTNISQSNTIDDFNAQIDGNYVVWNGGNGDTEIWLYDIGAGGNPDNISLNDGNDDLSVKIDGNYVVWHGSDGSDSEIWLYDISMGGTATNISSNSNDDFTPYIKDNTVAWHGSDGTDFDIWIYDIPSGASPTKLTQNTVDDYNAYIDGNSLVWNDATQVWLHRPCVRLVEITPSVPEGDSGLVPYNFNAEIVPPFVFNLPITIDYMTIDGTASLPEGDYISVTGTTTFNPGSSLTQIVSITMNGDTSFEANEYFTLLFFDSSNSILMAYQESAVATILNDDPGIHNDGLIVFSASTTPSTEIYDSVQNNPSRYSYFNTPPGVISTPIWVAGDWNGDGEKTPGYFDQGVFRFTNDIGPTQNWSGGIWLGNAGSRVAVVSGRYTASVPNDCIGWIDSNTSPVTGDLRFSLKYWCDMTATGAVALSSQWLGAPLGDSQGYTGTHQFAYGDWDSDGLDEPGIRRAGRITRSNNAPSEGAATYPAGSAQRWDTGDGDGPGAHGLDEGLFVAGDWNADGMDTFGVVYDDNKFYYRDVFGFNPGPFEFSSQTFTSSIAAPRQVDSHHNAAGGSSAPAPANPDLVRGLESARQVEGSNFDTSQNIEAELSVSKAGNHSVGEVGLVSDSIVWTITVANTGTAPANGVQITDNVPAELRVDDALSENGTISVRGQSVIFTAESIGVGETVQFQVVTTILSQPTSGTFVNSVNVVLPDGNGGGSDANLVASGTVSSVDGLPTTGYAPRFRW